ncbi:MAG: hypothetical protein L0H41_11715 [Microlunatus sp.]|nr:hypothetical protein [Microlunatus sp.]MDN5804760.1 hypothetical protein [Microlunatus sp.]
MSNDYVTKKLFDERFAAFRDETAQDPLAAQHLRDCERDAQRWWWWQKLIHTLARRRSAPFRPASATASETSA